MVSTGAGAFLSAFLSVFLPFSAFASFSALASFSAFFSALDCLCFELEVKRESSEEEDGEEEEVVAGAVAAAAGAEMGAEERVEDDADGVRPFLRSEDDVEGVMSFLVKVEAVFVVVESEDEAAFSRAREGEDADATEARVGT